MTSNQAAITQDVATLAIRPLSPDDHRYAAQSWRESFKQSSASLQRSPWAMYKATVGTQIAGIVDRCSLLGAYVPDGRIAGWIAYTPGRSINTVHWVTTRHVLHDPTCPRAVPRATADCACKPESCRRRGVMAMLLEAAELGRRIAYTHRGPRRVVHHGGKERSADAARSSVHGPTADLAIVEWLRGRGVTAVFVDYQEWAR